eukprot:6390485-Pyramimonas_sp.AAC.1
MSNVSCADFGPTVLCEVSRQTVARAELRVGAALIAHAVNFGRCATLPSGPPPPPLPSPTCARQVRVFSYRSDATNSGIWQRQKLVALELLSYAVDIPQTADDAAHGPMGVEWMGRAVRWMKRLSDLQAVTAGTGEATFALAQKQLAALGAQLFSETCSAGVRWYVTTSDQGPGQVKCRKLTAANAADSVNSIFMSTDCLEHVGHLIIHDHLKL